jgi:hypothetical protein
MNIYLINKMDYSEAKISGFNIRQRSDGYLSGTDICKAGGKKFNHWFDLKTTKELIKELSRELNIPIENLLEVKKRKI